MGYKITHSVFLCVMLRPVQNRYYEKSIVIRRKNSFRKNLYRIARATFWKMLRGPFILVHPLEMNSFHHIIGLSSGTN